MEINDCRSPENKMKIQKFSYDDDKDSKDNDGDENGSGGEEEEGVSRKLIK